MTVKRMAMKSDVDTLTNTGGIVLTGLFSALLNTQQLVSPPHKVELVTQNCLG
jgi:hypothetical protein